MGIDQEKNVEDLNSSDSNLHVQDQDIKLDPFGLPLQPQPSKFSDDPLVSTVKFIRV